MRWDIDGWPIAVVALLLVASAVASAHAALKKRDVRAAIAWVGLSWLAPGVGPALYVLLGINRIRRRAAALQRNRTLRASAHPELVAGFTAAPERLEALGPALVGLERLSGRISGRPSVDGNRFDALVNGDEAYPQMLVAIDAARASITLCSFIFDHDDVGVRFVEALGRAVKRGVEVRVLVDGVGLRYSRRPITRALRAAGVRNALFLPTRVPAGLYFMNLRNHRKVMVVDGTLAFTGGMNLRAGHVLQPPPGHPVQDVHFRIEGPIVEQLQDVFVEDWAFAAREVLEGPPWYVPQTAHGSVLARVITDGPDNNLDILRTVMLGALASARHTVRIATPYFLPDTGLVSALAVAALRGVRVDILLPSRTNIPLVQWASMAQLWQVLEPGCRVHFSPPPFDHSKLMVVDDAWTLLGSTNWDPRSLRLNFELNVEAYDEGLARRVAAILDERIARSRTIGLDDVDARSLLARVRDGLARLMSPYL